MEEKRERYVETTTTSWKTGNNSARTAGKERSIRLLTNSHRSQSEKQWASRGRETAENRYV
jgi:hypothetical protein